MAIGVTYERFMNSCPRELKPFLESYKIRRKMLDEQMWILGQYIGSALDSTVCNAFLWRRKGEKAHRYIEMPFMQKMEEQRKPLSKDELQRQRELFVAKLEVMKTNFELSHPKKQGGSVS